MLQSLLALAHPLLVPAFTAWGVPVTWIEVVAFAVSLWMVGCEMRVHPLAWPLAMLSSLLYALLFADSRLYGEASLQLFFVAMSLWGWWQWLRGHAGDGGNRHADHCRTRPDVKARTAPVEEAGEDVAALFVGAKEIVAEVPRGSNRGDTEAKTLRVRLHHAHGFAVEADGARDVGGEGIFVGNHVRVDGSEETGGDDQEKETERQHGRPIPSQLSH